MRKYNTITIALIVLCVLTGGTALAESSEPFPDEEWNRTYFLGTVYDTQWMEQTSDGGYVIIGSMNSFSHGNSLSKEYFVLKASAKGEEQWSRKFREEDEDRSGYGIQTYIMQTTDSGYLIAGSTENFTTGSLNIWIRKMDAGGTEQWKKDFRENRSSRQFFGGNNVMDIIERYNKANRSVRETPDGSFLILGTTNHCQDCSIEKESAMDIWLMKIGPKGNEEWNRTLGRTDEAAYSFTMTPDGGFILAGMIFPDTIMFKKSDRKGNELWNRTYDGIVGREIVIRHAPDGGYAAAIANPSASQISLLKVDPDGLKQWQKTYSVSSWDSSFYDFKYTQDSGFLLWQSAWPDSSLLKVDRDGNEQWRRNIDDFVISYVEQTKDGDYLLTATKLSDDVIMGGTIEKLDSHGNKLWEKVVGLSWSISTRRKNIAAADNGFVVTGSSDISMIMKKFKNRDIPYAVFTYEPEYPGVNQTVTFDASVSNDPNGNITNYRWDFGDGNITDTTGNKVTHSYGRTGEAIVRLMVMNSSGGVNSTWKKVFVQKLAAPEEILNVSFGNYSGAKYAEETSDGGFIIGGRNESNYEGWLVKTDRDGKEELNWKFEGNELKSIIQTRDGGFMASGDNFSDIKLVKLDQKGKEQWTTTFEDKRIGPNLGFGLVSGKNGTVIQTHEGGYVIAGINKYDVGDDMDAWLMKTDPEGNIMWSRILRGSGIGWDILSGVQETSDGGYILTGTWWRLHGDFDPEAILMKTDQAGNEKWEWTRMFSENDQAGSGLQTPDGGFTMMGTSSYLNQSTWSGLTGPEWETDIWLMKTDVAGKEQWRKSSRIKSMAYAASFSTTGDGGYIYSAIVHDRPENDYEKTDIYSVTYSVKFVKLDPDGNIEWQKRDEGYSIKPTSDGGFVTARGSSLVKLGWIKSGSNATASHDANQTQAPAAVPMKNNTITPEKAAGFESVFSIMIILALHIARRKRR